LLAWIIVPDVSPDVARAALVLASHSAAQVRTRARWMSRYLATFAGGFAGVTLLLGLMRPLWLRMSIFGVAWPLLIVSMQMWAARRPAHLHATRRRVAKYWIGTGALYGAVLVVGTPALLGRALYWIPAAALVAIPLLIGSWRERYA